MGFCGPRTGFVSRDLVAVFEAAGDFDCAERPDFCFRLDHPGGHALEYHFDCLPGKELKGPDEVGILSACPLVVGTGGFLEGAAPTFHGICFRCAADEAEVLELCDVNGVCP